MRAPARRSARAASRAKARLIITLEQGDSALRRTTDLAAGLCIGELRDTVYTRLHAALSTAQLALAAAGGASRPQGATLRAGARTRLPTRVRRHCDLPPTGQTRTRAQRHALAARSAKTPRRARAAGAHVHTRARCGAARTWYPLRYKCTWRSWWQRTHTSPWCAPITC